MDKFTKENLWELYKKVNSKDLEKIIENLQEIKNEENYKKVLSVRENYFVESHQREFNQSEYEKAISKKLFRKEEWTCKRQVKKEFKLKEEKITIIDYQIPLKHELNDNTKGFGKIDLLANINNTIYLLEVKTINNTETPLKAILEIYTY